MLTQLTTVKSRLAIDPLDTTFDDLLTNGIKAVSARFDKATNRTLARSSGATFEFDICDTEIIVPSYPIESVTKFEIKTSETEGWVEQTDIDYLIRRKCVVSLAAPLSLLISSAPAAARVTYTGGYVLPGTTVGPGQATLPDDLEQAAVEQVSAWFQNRDKLGLTRNWPHAGTYQQFSQAELLPSVAATIKQYQRLCI